MAKRTGASKKKIATITEFAVDSISTSQPGGMPPPADNAAQPQEKKMTLTFKSLDKRGRNAIYHGAAVSLRFPIGAFPSKTPPATLAVDGLAEKTERVKLTAEQRKALPKPTLAERVKKAEEKAAALKEKLTKQTEAPVSDAPAV